ncbi:DUF4838 domain-containing protein [Phycisphaerales bacterium AB-hyl4]|uniref:DUF4838 domain-containing protein n=1 Tax=Natronomicrosphaera hydrolytica TaxID=3242702 RepID=A0ABV4UBC4_9BACT
MYHGEKILFNLCLIHCFAKSEVAMDACMFGEFRVCRWLVLGVCMSLMVASASLGEEAGEVVLVEPGKALPVIVIPQDAPPHTAEAAEELAHYLSRIVGADEIVVTDEIPNGSAGATIWVGHRPEVEDVFGAEPFAFERPEAFVVMAQPGHVAIVGRDAVVGRAQVESGTANGVYTFLQKHLGVRWLWPGELGEDVPSRERVAFESFVYEYHPQLRQRLLRLTTNRAGHVSVLGRTEVDRPIPDLEAIAKRKDEEVSRWQRVQRLAHGSFNMRAQHAFQDWWSRYQADNPDFFALQPDGGRGRNIATGWSTPGQHIKLCVSNPRVWDQWLVEVERDLANRPHLTVFSGSPNDGTSNGYCVCEDCRAWDPDSGPTVELRWDGHEEEHVALTDRYVRFWNKLARGLRDRYGDRDMYVGAWAYAAYRTPPVETALEPNVAIGFVGNLPASPTAQREQDKENWRQWAEMAEKMVWRPNLGHAAAGLGYWGLPLLYTARAGEDFAFLADHNMMGLDVDSVYHHWSTQGPQYYVLAQLAWDPRADVQALLDDYYERGFGSAASSIQAYFDLFERVQYEVFEAGAGLSREAHIEKIVPEFYTAELLEEADALLRVAEAQVQDGHEILRDRVAFIRTGFELIEAQVELMAKMTAIREGASPAIAVDAFQRTQQLFENNFDNFALGYLQYMNFKQYRRLQRYLGPPIPEMQQTNMIPLSADSAGIKDPEQLVVRRRATFMVYADGGERVTLELENRQLSDYDEALTFVVQGPNGALVEDGSINVGRRQVVTFTAPSRGTYRVHCEAGRNRIGFRTTNRAVMLMEEGVRARLSGDEQVLYFWVPEDIDSFEVYVSGRGERSLARAELLDPQGSVQAEVDNIDGDGHSFQMKMADSLRPGLWTLKVGPGSKRRAQDIFVRLGGTLPQVFAVEPKGMLLPEEFGKDWDAGDPSVQ